MRSITTPRRKASTRPQNSLVGTPPCDTCEHATRCRDERLACQSFIRFLNSRKDRPFDDGGARVPTATWFNRINRESAA